MIPFLQAVAEGYASHYADIIDRICFIFPNKRARTFFMKYIRNALIYKQVKKKGATFVAPQLTTISDFTSSLSGKIVDSRIDLIFLLFKCYKELYPDGASFDSFRRWGETVLSDFEEVDMNLADPEALFKNLSDFRNISSSFLSKQQREIIEEYFGYRFADYENTNLWLDFNIPDTERETPDSEGTHLNSPSGKISEGKRKFIRLWKILHPLYKKFHEELRLRGYTTSGASYREAIEILKKARDNDSLQDVIHYSKIVMVGFNALSGSEIELFRILKSIPSPDIHDEPMGDFIWDAAGPIICGDINNAGHFVKLNTRNFPPPAWIAPYLKKCDASENIPEICSIAAPSNVAQVKIASDLISQLKEEIGSRDFDMAKVALILSDESLLIPMLYSLPNNIENINLTMGYPLKLTSVTSFLMLLRRMQLMRRDTSSYSAYSFQEVDNLLSHPYAQMILGSGAIRNFRKEFSTRHIRVIREDHISKWFGQKGEVLLRPIPNDATPEEICSYLHQVLEIIERFTQNPIEKTHVEAWQEAITLFSEAIRDNDIKMSKATTLSEAYRLLMGETVAFEGEPLKGLQIMGMLETRCLDFDYVFILSANDKTLPLSSRKSSFLPNIIRYGYGLPPVNYQETIFSYYFFHLISRAKKVALVYDNRSSGLSGGISRYLLQLKYLHARDSLKEIEYRYFTSAPQEVRIVIPKNEAIMERLMEFTPKAFIHSENDKPRFSASLLKKYIDCPLKFYYYAVKNLKDDPLPEEGVSNITFGTVLHETMERLYLPLSDQKKGRHLKTPVLITPEFIDSLLADNILLKSIIQKMINKYHYHIDDLNRKLESDTEIVASSLLTQIRNILKYDRSLAPFKIYGCELRDNVTLSLNSGLEIDLTFAIDRIDDAECKEETGALRIIDYKTGSPHVKAASIEAIFDDDYKSSHLFQLLLYSYLFNETRVREGEEPVSLKPLIYPTPRIYYEKGREDGIPVVGNTKILWHDAISDETSGLTVIDEFMGEFESMIEEIYDKDTPFAGIYDEQKCRGCVFSSICSNQSEPIADSIPGENHF